jgi:rhamnose transport system permease protein
VTVFAFSGVCAAIAGLLIDSRLGVARYDHGLGLELDAITTVVLGGAAIAGGIGSILGTSLALILIAVIRIGMGLANVTAEYQLAIVGALLIIAVAFGQYFERRSARSARPTKKTIAPPRSAPS